MPTYEDDDNHIYIYVYVYIYIGMIMLVLYYHMYYAQYANQEIYLYMVDYCSC